MNFDALLATRDAIENSPDEYWQLKWSHPCGSPACVAGFAVHAAGLRMVTTLVENSSPGKGWSTVMENGESARSCAARVLGLDAHEADSMFALHFGASAASAVAMLDHFMETGIVDWAMAIDRTKEDTERPSPAHPA